MAGPLEHEKWLQDNFEINFMLVWRRKPDDGGENEGIN
jgi:hypothetical protein